MQRLEIRPNGERKGYTFELLGQALATELASICKHKAYVLVGQHA